MYEMEKDEYGLWIVPDTMNKVGKGIKFKNTLMELHEKYGHISFDALKRLPEAIHLRDQPNPTCIACAKGKSTKPASKGNHNPIRTSRPLERLHCDLIGPFKKEWKGCKYVLTLLDDYTRFCSAIPIRSKADTTSRLKQFIEELERATDLRVVMVQADWGGEFRNDDLKAYIEQKGIKMKETVPYHSETNAAIERLNQTLETTARVALIHAGLPTSMWGDAIQWAAYTKNRLPHRSLPGKQSPIEVLFPTKYLDRSNLRPFGQNVIAYQYKVKDKMAARGSEAKIIGYSDTYGVYHTITSSGKRQLAKDPKPIDQDEEEELQVPIESDDNSLIDEAELPQGAP